MAGETVRHSIAICTARGEKILRVVLPRLAAAIADGPPTEVLLVNNDDVSALGGLQDCLACAFAGTSVQRILLHEPTPGLSLARNAALEAARGEILTFIDDDAAPRDRRWQTTILRAFANKPDVGLVGGPVHLVPPPGQNPNPWWRGARTDGLLSAVSMNGPSAYCDPAGIPGVNASYRRSAIGSWRFDARLGVNRTVALALVGEETMLNWTLENAGWRAWFEQEATVDHHIGSERWNPRWLLRRARVAGRSVVATAHIRRLPVPWFGACKLMVTATLKALVRTAQGKLDRAFSNACDIMAAYGHFEMLAHRRPQFMSEPLEVTGKPHAPGPP